VNGGTPPSFPTVGAALEWAQRELAGSESGPLEAQVLLAHLRRQPRCWVLAHPELPLPPDFSTKYESLIRRARAGEPLAYLTGVQEFFGLEFEVAPDVLIPRPETEFLVATALLWLEERFADPAFAARPLRVLDLGTGCACIAVTLALRNPGLCVIATDISSAALAVAARNAARHGIRGQIRLLQADLLAPLRGPVDLLCANLPYALTPILEGLPVLRHEPRLALDGGTDGLRLIGQALEQSAPRMAADGLALFEIDAVHASAAQVLARRQFPRASVAVEKDLAGLDRLLIIRT
jgi:release factor glutamine methyltransferase